MLIALEFINRIRLNRIATNAMFNEIQYSISEEQNPLHEAGQTTYLID